MAFGKKPCCDGCARKPSKARISGNPIAHLFQMGGEVMKELESTDPLFIHEDEGYNTAVLSDMLRRDVEFDPEESYVTRQQLEELLREGVINEEEYLAELAYMPDTPVEEEPDSPTPLELYVEEMTGLEAGADRMTLLPFAPEPRYDELGTPAWKLRNPMLTYEIMKAISTPGFVLQGGQVTPEETFNTALMATSGGLGTSAIRRGSLPREPGAVELGMASVAPGGINFNRFPLRKKYKESVDSEGRVGSYTDKPTSVDPRGTWYSPTDIMERAPYTEDLADKLSVIDQYIAEVEQVFNDRGYTPGEYGPALFKTQQFLEKDYLTHMDPLRGALHRGEIPSTSLVDSGYYRGQDRRAAINRFEEILKNPLEASVLAHDEKLRRPLYKKLQRNEPLSVEEQIIWDNPPPIRIEAEKLYDEFGEASAYQLFPTEEAQRAAMRNQWPLYSRPRRGDPARIPREPVAEALRNYPRSLRYTLEEMVDEDTGLVDAPANWMGLKRGEPDPSKVPAIAMVEGRPMTIGERHLEAKRELDSTFARALEEQNEAIFLPYGIIYSHTRPPFLQPETVVDYLTAGVKAEDLADISTRSSWVDRYTSGARLVAPARQFKALNDRVNYAMNHLTTSGTEAEGGFPNYAAVDKLIPEDTWTKGTTVVLDNRSTNSSWAKVDDTKLLSLYGNYLGNSIGGYSVLGNTPDYPGWGGYNGPRAIEEGAVEIYALHDNATGAPRLIVEVFKGYDKQGNRIDSYVDDTSRINQVKGRVGNNTTNISGRIAPGPVSVEGNRPPHSRDVESLLALFNQLDIPPPNVKWESEFINTIRQAPVDDPLRRAYVRYVDEENDSLLPGDPEQHLNDNDMAMLVRRGGSREDTPADLPWIVGGHPDTSVARFFEDLYGTYNIALGRKPQGRDVSVSDTVISLEPLQEAAARPEPLITEW